MILYACFCVCLDRGKFVITILYHDTTFPSPNIMVHDYGFSCNYEQQIMHQNKIYHPSVTTLIIVGVIPVSMSGFD